MQASPNQIATVLGLPDTTTALDLAEFCEAGIPVESLDALAECFVPNEQVLLDSLFAEPTLRRRRRHGRLTSEESDAVIRLAAIWLFARDIFRDPGKAQRFLTMEHPLLGGRRPLDLAQSSTSGGQAVEELLGRLKYGSAA